MKAYWIALERSSGGSTHQGSIFSKISGGYSKTKTLALTAVFSALVVVMNMLSGPLALRAPPLYINIRLSPIVQIISVLVNPLAGVLSSVIGNSVFNYLYIPEPLAASAALIGSWIYWGGFVAIACRGGVTTKLRIAAGSVWCSFTIPTFNATYLSLFGAPFYAVWVGNFSGAAFSFIVCTPIAISIIPRVSKHLAIKMKK